MLDLLSMKAFVKTLRCCYALLGMGSGIGRPINYILKKAPNFS